MFYFMQEKNLVKVLKLYGVTKKNNEYLGYYDDDVTKFLEPQQNDELVELIQDNKCIVNVNGEFVLPQKYEK